MSLLSLASPLPGGFAPPPDSPEFHPPSGSGLSTPTRSVRNTPSRPLKGRQHTRKRSGTHAGLIGDFAESHKFNKGHKIEHRNFHLEKNTAFPIAGLAYLREKYCFKLFGEGNFHEVNEFDQRTITIIDLTTKETQIIFTADVVIKISRLKEGLNGKDYPVELFTPKKIALNAINGYRDLQISERELGVKLLPHVYVGPRTRISEGTAFVFNHAVVKESESKSEKSETEEKDDAFFWIQEKLVSEVSTKEWSSDHKTTTKKTYEELSGNDKKVILFACNIFKKTAEKGREIINDFYPRNVMWNKNNELRIADFSPLEPDDELLDLPSQMCQWADGNENIWKMFLESIKGSASAVKCANEWLQEHQKMNEGRFPTSQDLARLKK